MKIKLLIIVISLGLSVSAQNNWATRANKISKLDSLPNTIENQFKKTYGKANNWKEFKMIKRVDFIKFQKTILDSVSEIKQVTKTKQNTIVEQQTKIDSLQGEITNLNSELNEYKGAEGSENNIKTILFGIIGALILGLGFFIFKYKNSNTITKNAQKNLTEIEEEFEDYRKRSLEREQKLRRQLQDEINKQRGV